jgi:hypothetical protein
MHRYIQAQGAHTYQESSETEFESDYYADFDQNNISHFTAVKLGILMIIYCLALTVRGVWRGVCHGGQFLWRVI